MKPVRDVARDIAGDILLAWLSKEPLNRAIDRLAVRIEDERAEVRLATINERISYGDLLFVGFCFFMVGAAIGIAAAF